MARPLSSMEKQERRLRKLDRTSIEGRISLDDHPLEAKRCQCDSSITAEDLDGFRVCVKCGRMP